MYMRCFDARINIETQRSIERHLVSTHQLGSRKIRLHKPVRITAAVGHAWFPTIHQFASGELFAEWSMMPDIHCFAYVAGASHSLDGGKTWSRAYSFNNFSNQCLPLPDGSMRRVPYYFYPSPPTQMRNFTTDLATVWPGGRSEMTPHGATVSFPRDVQVSATGAAYMNFTGAPIFVGGRWITTVYGAWNDDPKPADRHNFCLHILETRDLGKTWSFVATVAEHQQMEPLTPEGPCEACLCELEGGEVLCVYRVGSNWNFRASRSKDGGRTWSKFEILDGPLSVEPSLKRLKNGVLALSGGRAGNWLWLADDKVGKKWHAIDITAHHNAACDADEKMATDGTQTTAYSELVEFKPNHLMYVYDRCPLGWNSVPLESEERNMIFGVEIVVE